MNIFSRVTRKSLWQNKTRTWVTVMGIILSTAMFTAVCTMAVSIWDFLVRGAKENYGNYFVRYDYMTQEQLDTLASDRRVEKLTDYQVFGYYCAEKEIGNAVFAAVPEGYFADIGIDLVSGSRLPKSSSEIILPKDLAAEQNLDIGNTITLTLCTHPDTLPEMVPTVASTTFTKTYTIVGLNYNTHIGSDLNMESAFTLADGDQGDALWHRAYIQCDPGDAFSLGKEGYGPEVYVNKPLLAYYGQTEYRNESETIFALAAFLLAIILLGAVSLIYNAFSISVSQRTRQFGLLRSIGATKKQLRRMVYREGLYLCLLGIPAGLAAGYGGLAITMGLLRQKLDMFFAVGMGQAVTLRLVLSPIALAAAGLIALVTVLLSAAVPAHRATRVSPMDCIRQTRDYHSENKPIKAGWASKQLLGLSGMLAKKYYTVSRSKYRPTVLSLAVSIVLFLTAAGYTQTIQTAARENIRVENYDIYCFQLPDMGALPQQEFVKKYALHASEVYMTYLPEESYSPEELAYYQACKKGEYNSYTTYDLNNPGVVITYLQDDVLRAYLESQGIDPAPYFQPEDPLALVAQRRYEVIVKNDDGTYDSLVLTHPLLAQDVQQVDLFPRTIPIDALKKYTPWENGDVWYDTPVNEQGAVVVKIDLMENYLAAGDFSQEAICFPVEFSRNDAGQGVVSYYRLAPDTGEKSPEPVARETIDAPVFRLGAVIQEIPYGLNNALLEGPNLNIIMPLSMAGGDAYGPVLSMDVSDHAAAIEWLESQQAGYTDFMAGQETNRTLLLMIKVFSYGFIMLISLIAASNVFNTVSTNIQLRRRDFGMLKSVGMTQGGIGKMLALECMGYGLKALLYGLPPSIAICWLMYQQTANRTTTEGFALPWGAMAIACVSVFAVVFASMLYALHKLRQQDPIEAIRQENI